MAFLDRIIDYILDIAKFFLWLSHEVRDWPWIGTWAADLFVYIADAFARMAYQFKRFNDWAADVTDRVEDILNLDEIKKTLAWWLDRATWAWNWVSNAWYNVWYIIDDWWGATAPLILSWIADVKWWTVGQLNNLLDLMLILISDVKAWTTYQLLIISDSMLILISDVKWWTIYQLNNLLDSMLILISDVKAWTTYQLNNLLDLMLILISDVKAWTTYQINTFTTSISAIVADFKNWATGEINSFRATIEALDPWAMIQTALATWWTERLKDIDALAITKLKEWFPFYDTLVELWSSIAEFFTDPEEWLYKAVDRIIERFW